MEHMSDILLIPVCLLCMVVVSVYCVCSVCELCGVSSDSTCGELVEFSGSSRSSSIAVHQYCAQFSTGVIRLPLSEAEAKQEGTPSMWVNVLQTTQRAKHIKVDIFIHTTTSVLASSLYCCVYMSCVFYSVQCVVNMVLPSVVMILLVLMSIITSVV